MKNRNQDVDQLEHQKAGKKGGQQAKLDRHRQQQGSQQPRGHF